MAFLSLLPAVGAALVWLPVAIYLMVTGAFWQGLVLIAYGACVIGLVDNLLRPILVGSDTKMPDYLVLLRRGQRWTTQAAARAIVRQQIPAGAK
jgi:predicted PurR-regulated permease PerM